MKLCTIGHNFRYELEKLCRIFFPFEKIIFTDKREIEPFSVVCSVEGNNIKSEVYASDISYSDSAVLSEGDDAELCLAVMLFEQLCKLTSYRPEWGVLTGVRPAKLYRKLETGASKQYADDYFTNTLKVSTDKTELCSKTALSEEGIINLSKDNSFSLYVSIPFCPSRCSYCSFVSHSVDKAGKLIPEYLKLLHREIELCGRIVKEKKLVLETVYIGGGTPTVLSAEQLEELIGVIQSNFDMSTCLEFTVEAGRPDTVTDEKLIALKKHGVTRISINPQTFNDSVLENIGRKHTAKDTVDAFMRARAAGHTNINMDLIAGLEGDTLESFKETLRKVIELSPESVTVHSLSVKRASTLNVSGRLPETEMGKAASGMVKFAERTLSDAGILPYYMYRQSKTVGNLENVGYAKKGYEGLYNVYIMDETHTIIACGASGVTKLKQPGVNNIERIYNFKYPYEYISRFDEVCERKNGIGEFYDKYCITDK